MDQYLFAATQLADMMERMPSGHEGSWQSDRLFEAHGRRIAGYEACIAGDVRAEASRPDGNHLVAGAKIGDARADTLDNTRAFHAEGRLGENARCFQHIGKIECRRRNPDLDLAGPWV